MKVILINGSPHENGCTYTALAEVAGALEKNGVHTQIYHIGKKAVHGCIACGRCQTKGMCAFDDDSANEMLALMQSADGIVIGSPVYYAGPNGALCALLDRVFYADNGSLAFKPAAAVVSARRGGTTAAFDRLNKYFTMNRMPVVSSQYWNSVHGFTPEDVRQDKEGLQTMRTLGYNMAWMLKSIADGAQPLPEIEPWLPTHFIQ
ncbi:flavodoxin family protein [Lachnoclostridium pacaense]|uniref:flavodoxin family protein n=1 Tax=Enterocloster hominis (ex Hitch et al. 2024) TaxID=1917870 RepID=UPI001D106976|nr:flavodoxin family protein [Lachnoclostridium pacaense]MCC2820225.1 flavodoxin family protein [Lachnoclostridium pacaense]